MANTNELHATDSIGDLIADDGQIDTQELEEMLQIFTPREMLSLSTNLLSGLESKENHLVEDRAALKNALSLTSCFYIQFLKRPLLNIDGGEIQRRLHSLTARIMTDLTFI